MLRFLGLGALLLTVVSTVSAGERYVEVWNPPEARADAPPAKLSHKQSIHRHSASRTVKYHARSARAPAPKLIAKQREIPADSRTATPDLTDIPRQITPEGNILRVDSRQAYVGVSR
ncbi:hypothetical protein BCh11DRAFT_07169 [Burkholderia sp. Ch1-1]|uniref:Uncharacterized protein n=2 Tax=Burkholderiaceae TaxID=119060 RepID=A0A5Q4Z991_9BURK|nr:hypothetical protein BCh11DRAFT_07169 [Burkholderia sp. Ch1-1]VVD28083.1 conserved exported protein of unknown function [Paraburkholderia dioscoreae]